MEDKRLSLSIAIGKTTQDRNQDWRCVKKTAQSTGQESENLAFLSVLARRNELYIQPSIAMPNTSPKQSTKLKQSIELL